MKYQIHYKENSPLTWGHCMEWQTTIDIIKALSEKLDDSWKLIFTDQKDNLPSFEGHDPKKIIVIQISDETYSIPSYHKDVAAVFKHYVRSDCEAENVYPIPQGVMTGFLNLPYRKIKDRSIDVLFTGNMHTVRKGIIDGLKKRLTGKCNFVFMENNSVSLPLPKYSHYLMDSKISLDLHGAQSPETFRFFESLKMGCVTLSCPKPENWIYRDDPSTKVDWSNLDAVADTILSFLESEDKMNGESREGLSYIEKILDPNTVASRIFDILNGKNVSKTPEAPKNVAVSEFTTDTVETKDATPITTVKATSKNEANSKKKRA